MQKKWPAAPWSHNLPTIKGIAAAIASVDGDKTSKIIP